MSEKRKQIDDLNEWIYECIYERLEIFPFENEDHERHLDLYHFCAAGLINTVKNVDKYGDVNGLDWEIACSVVDYVTWADYYKTYKFNRKRPGCRFVQSRSCIEGDDEDIAFIKVETLTENVWICANCFGICRLYTNRDINSFFCGTMPATIRKWGASQVLDPDYLEAVKKGIID